MARPSRCAAATNARRVLLQRSSKIATTASPVCVPTSVPGSTLSCRERENALELRWSEIRDAQQMPGFSLLLHLETQRRRPRSASCALCLDTEVASAFALAAGLP
jgi:hypothetical protein